VTGQLYALAALSPEKEIPVPFRIAGWVGHRIRLDLERRKILPILGLELRPLGRINDAKFLPCKTFYEQSA
jgi:hypothetical protein